MLRFSQWLKQEKDLTFESGTSTGDVANFSRPLFEKPIRRGKKRIREDFQTQGTQGINPNIQPGFGDPQQQQTNPQQQNNPQQPNTQQQQQKQGPGFHFKGSSGQSNNLYKQGVNALLELAKRQKPHSPEVSSVIKKALVQMQNGILQIAQNKKQQQNNQRTPEENQEVDDMVKAFGGTNLGGLANQVKK